MNAQGSGRTPPIVLKAIHFPLQSGISGPDDPSNDSLSRGESADFNLLMGPTPRQTITKALCPSEKRPIYTWGHGNDANIYVAAGCPPFLTAVLRNALDTGWDVSLDMHNLFS